MESPAIPVPMTAIDFFPYCDLLACHFCVDRVYRAMVMANGCDLITLTDPHTRLRPGQELPVVPVAPLFFDANGVRIRA